MQCAASLFSDFSPPLNSIMQQTLYCPLPQCSMQQCQNQEAEVHPEREQLPSPNSKIPCIIIFGVSLLKLHSMYITSSILSITKNLNQLRLRQVPPIHPILPKLL